MLSSPNTLVTLPPRTPLAQHGRFSPCRQFLTFATSLTLLSTSPPAAHALNTADGTSGEWSNPTVWSGDVPTTSDNENDVTLRSGASITVSSGTAGVFSRIQIGRDGIAGTASTLTIAGGSFHAAGSVSNGPSEIGSTIARTGVLVLQSGLASFSNRQVHTSASPGSVGNIVQTGGTFVCDDQLHIGHDGNSTMTLSGGQMIVGNNTRIASEAGNLATVNITGGILRSNAFLSGPLIIGRHGAATVTVSGGTILCGPDSSIATSDPGNEGQNLNIGDGLGTGHLIIQGPNSVVQIGDRFRIGRNTAGTGIVDLNGGTLTSDGQVLIGQSSGSSGTLNITGGFFDSDADDDVFNFRRAVVGNFGRGFVSLSGGTMDIGGNFWIGNESGSVGSFVQTGGLFLPASATANGQGLSIGRFFGSSGFMSVSGGTMHHFVDPGSDDGFMVGEEGDGILHISNQARFITNDHLIVGVEFSGTGTAQFNGGTVNAAELTIAQNGSGLATINGSAQITTDTDLNIADGSNGVGHLTIAGDAVVVVGRSLLVGNGSDSIATLTITGLASPHISLGSHCQIGTGFGSDATATLAGGTLTIPGDLNIGNFLQSSAAFQYSGGALQLSGSLALDGPATLRISPPLAIQTGKGFAPTLFPGLDFGETIDLTGITPPIPNPDHVTVQTGSYFFLVVNDRTGASGGNNLTTNTALDTLALAGVPFPLGAMRLSEADFEANSFNPLTQHVFAFVEEQVAANIGRVGLRWSIAPEPKPITLAQFAADNGVPNDPAENSDKDDATLLSEFAFNRNPNLSDTTTLTPSTGLFGLPFVSIVGTGTEAHLRVEFIRRTLTTAPGLNYTVQFGNSLNSLTDFAGVETIIPIDLFWERVIVNDPVTAGSAPSRFSQVKVTYSP